MATFSKALRPTLYPESATPSNDSRNHLARARIIFWVAIPQRSKNLFRRDWQIHDPYADGIVNRVCYRRRNLGDGAFTDLFTLERRRARIAADEGCLQGTEVLDVRYFVFTEVQGYDPPIFYHHLFRESVTHALNNAAVDLPLVADRIQNRRDVMNRIELAQVDLTGLRVNVHLGHASCEHSFGGCFGRFVIALDLERVAFGRHRGRNLSQRQRSRAMTFRYQPAFFDCNLVGRYAKHFRRPLP